MSDADRTLLRRFVALVESRVTPDRALLEAVARIISLQLKHDLGIDDLDARARTTVAAGRRAAVETRRARAAEKEQLIRAVILADQASGRSDWGRAGRVARNLARAGLSISERHVLRKISDMTGSAPVMSDSLEHHRDVQKLLIGPCESPLGAAIDGVAVPMRRLARK